MAVERAAGNNSGSMQRFYFVLDTSGSMRGASITALNDAMRHALERIAESCELYNISADLSVLEYNSVSRWILLDSRKLKRTVWNDLNAGGWSALGSALAKLNARLIETDTQMRSTPEKPPVIIFVSDGGPTDDYGQELKRLNSCSQFSNAVKYAFALGREFDAEALVQIAGSEEAVIRISDIKKLGTQLADTCCRILASAGSRKPDRTAAGSHPEPSAADSPKDNPAAGSNAAVQTPPKVYVQSGYQSIDALDDFE